MTQIKQEYDTDLINNNSPYKTIYWLGGVASMILIAYSLITMLIIVFIGRAARNNC